MGDEVKQGLAAKGSQDLPSIDDVVQMLKQGMQPEDIVKMGVPVELIQAAVQILMKEMGQAGGMQPQTQSAPPPEGLAGARVQSVTDDKAMM